MKTWARLRQWQRLGRRILVWRVGRFVVGRFIVYWVVVDWLVGRFVIRRVFSDSRFAVKYLVTGEASRPRRTSGGADPARRPVFFGPREPRQCEPDSDADAPQEEEAAAPPPSRPFPLSWHSPLPPFFRLCMRMPGAVARNRSFVRDDRSPRRDGRARQTATVARTRTPPAPL